MAYLKKKKGFLLVSHDRYFLDGCVDHILAINKEGIEICQGNFTVWQENKERKDAYEADEQERLKKENKEGIEICQGNFTVWQENKERKDAYEADEQERLKKEIGKLTKAAGRTAGWSDQIEKSKVGCQGNFTVWQENKERKDAYEADEQERLKKEIGKLTKAAGRTAGWSDQIEKSKVGNGPVDRGYIGHQAARIQERLKKEIGKLTKAAGRTAGWSDQIEKSKVGNGPVDRGYIGHQAARMMKRALVIEQRAQKAVEEKKKLLKNLEKAEELKLFPLRHHRETVIRDITEKR